MRFAILGSAADGQCIGVAQAFARRGAQAIIIEGDALHRGEACTFDGSHHIYRGELLDDIGGWYVRRILSPLPPAFEIDDRHHLFDDWLTDYMHRRERFGFLLSWLLAERARGVPMLNPPEQSCGVQMKAFQLAAARAAGLDVPETIITNDPDAVRAFYGEVGHVVYKPSMGGDLCRPLDGDALQRLEAIARHPVTFQERIEGTSIRATVVGRRVVSCVEIPTPSLDYRGDPGYREGGQRYVDAELPKDVEARLFDLLDRVGLSFAGVDFIRSGDRHVFLEANSSPVYLDIEKKMGHPISDAIAAWILRRAGAQTERPATEFASEARSEPQASEAGGAGFAGTRRDESFITYASPLEKRRGPEATPSKDRAPVART
jgi:glutathione synthase/RimK-type ligase-like ATP-grasp enzyme